MIWGQGMREIPAVLRNGPFTRQQAQAARVSRGMFDGQRFVRVLPNVWRLRDHVMTEEDWVMAAALALPDDARPTGITLIQRLGLDYGPRRPIRFVVARDLHLDLEGIFLHRTVRMPPLGPFGVNAAAAFISYCSLTRVVDAIKVGDWLLRNGHMTLTELHDLAWGQLWRAGAAEALWLLEHLDGSAWSLKESELRSVLAFAGLPRPLVNVDLGLDPVRAVVGDLWFRDLGVLVEYQGRHHQEDRGQYHSDIDRFALVRRHRVRYVEVTHELLSQPRAAVARVHAELVAAGYDGPPPVFGERWRQLFSSVALAVGPRDWAAVS